MPLSKLKLILTTTVIYSLTACSSHADKPERRDNKYQESLETKILSDGSKVFNFSLSKQNSKQDNQNEQGGDGERPKQEKPGARGDKPAGKKGGREANNGKPNTAKNKSSERNKELDEYFQKRIANLNILKMFCRQGYFILEEYSDNREISIKAECKESASIEDYNRFTKAK